MTKVPILAIVGGGLDADAHLTREACGWIARAQVVFYPQSCYALLPVQFKNNRTVWKNTDAGRYRMGEHRPSMYAEIAEEVLIAAHCYGTAVLIEPGSAVVLDSITSSILERAPQFDVDVTIVPGISSIEMVMCALRIDPRRGMQVLAAREAVMGRVRLNGALPTIILQPGYFDTLEWLGNDYSTTQNYAALFSYLIGELGAEAIATLAHFATGKGNALSDDFMLCDWKRPASIISPFHTLVIRPG